MERGYQKKAETFCKSCNKFIATQNFLIHQGRCERQKQLRSSRASYQSSQSNQSSSKKSSFWNNSPNQNSYSPNRNFAKQENSKIFNSNSSKKQKERPIIQETQKIPCHFCGYPQTMQQLDSHPNSCEHWQIQCSFCQSRFPKSLMDQHKVICNQNPDNLAHQRQYQQRQRQRQRQMYQPSSLMDMFMGRNMMHQHQEQDSQSSEGSRRQIHIFRIQGQNGQGRIIMQNNSSHPANFIRLMQILTGLQNHNQNPGLEQQQLRNLKKIKYINDKSQPDTCTICFCEFEQNEQLIELKCKHKYHQECIFQWLKRVSTCPNCKKHIREQENSNGGQRNNPSRNHQRNPFQRMHFRGQGFF